MILESNLIETDPSRYDPEAVIDDDEREEVSQYENAPKHRSMYSDEEDDEDSSETESNDSADEEESSDDYDGEYESVTTSSDDEEEEDEEVRRVMPAATSQPRTSVASPKKRRSNNRLKNNEAGSSTEVGSEDLSSDEDTDDMSDFGSDFSSGTATECEFTDSEGRPNPFHKQLEVPDIVVEPGSPAAQPRMHKRGTVLDQGRYSAMSWDLPSF